MKTSTTYQSKTTAIIRSTAALILTTATALLTANVSATEASWPCLNPPTMSSTVPGDTAVSDQAGVNCFAWQQFIAMNWNTQKPKTAAAFGEPGDYAPVEFETYISVSEFLKKDGSKPPPWNERAFAEYDKEEDIRKMYGTSKVNVDFDPNSDLAEAFPVDKTKAWLADKNGNLVWYEVLVNEDEYNYFYDNKFYDSTEQYKAAKAGRHINLPKGDLGNKTGAMEFKAAWLTVTNPEDKKWRRYKMTKANICSGQTQCKTQHFALVGLHIIHKTTAQASWIWTTFEHQDNSPDMTAVEKGPVGDGYTFYTDNCQQQLISPACVNGNIDQQTRCDVNQPPAYGLSFVDGQLAGQCRPYGIQVARQFPLPNTNENPVVAINKMAHKMITQANSDSVYQYYNLVNVLWNDSPVDENKGDTVPVDSLSQTGFRPNADAFPVANTVLETYIQSATCVSCHSAATINTPEGVNGPDFASDYSFIFSMAHPASQ
ncbi:hypothetical protein SIN8267_01129 [Sinobacterium norvegicum]|uniref:Cytochrome c family protein n=1 Tax=Sinobacterium norvegicum TaxID=1641715 RepID=A0ABN8EHE3_9GAMM|nr:hypothetical protein [Sinobacterium norvegicum]CAH0991028.1 hypothetical protein SIN8267_01129 [Sinobacterium norvegicum]